MDAGQVKQSLPEVNRRVRTSAAMIGLALSMGAHSLLVPRAGDKAMAAEPIAGEPATAPTNFDIATGSPTAEPVAPGRTETLDTVIDHVVREGQTIWQLAQRYGVDAATIAQANGVAVNAVLQVGQVLKVPASNWVAHATLSSAQADSAVRVAPEYYGLIANAPESAQSEADAALKAEQDTALNRLQDKRESLRTSLTRLKSVQPAPEAAASQAAVSTTLGAADALVNSVSEPSSIAVAPEPVPPQAASAETGQPQSTVGAELSPKTVPATAATPVLAEPQSKMAAVSESQQPESAPTLSVETRTPTVPALAAPVDDVSGTSADVVSYRVTPGDTLSTIARTYGISQRQLIEANKLTDPNLIRADQVLLIPRSSATEASGQPYVIASTAVVSSATVLPAVPSSGTTPTIAASPAAPRFSTANVAALPVKAAQPSIRNLATPADGLTPVPTTGVSGSEETTANRPNYVEVLRQDIVRLREKYRATAVGTTATAEVTKLAAATKPAVTSATPDRVNPEFNPEGAVAPSSKASARKLPVKLLQSVDARPPAAAQAAPQKMATASIGSPNYAPLIPSALGQMVSPDLPPLGPVDAYLPRGGSRSAGYIWPAKGVLTSGYGWRWGRMHKGIDIAAPVGTPIVAAAAGVVTYSGWNAGGYGNLVEITHPDGSVTLYAHNDRNLVREGQEVEQGQQIAEMGSTGYSTGPHSHFEVHLPGQGAVNPIAYLNRQGA